MSQELSYRFKSHPEGDETQLLMPSTLLAEVRQRPLPKKYLPFMFGSVNIDAQVSVIQPGFNAITLPLLVSDGITRGQMQITGQRLAPSLVPPVPFTPRLLRFVGRMAHCWRIEANGHVFHVWYAQYPGLTQPTAQERTLFIILHRGKAAVEVACLGEPGEMLITAGMRGMLSRPEFHGVRSALAAVFYVINEGYGSFPAIAA
ncbi:hypothetical protein MVEN_01105000 [Mycena venus]|uniref:Uncharacterized protein n=1 Tax=Mycena venus TaxID=2733690 RepID=A0A8H6Y6I3_9AGAR|nr:hypothetical protein MVEN_01105000 [Mycena venus]